MQRAFRAGTLRKSRSRGKACNGSRFALDTRLKRAQNRIVRLRRALLAAVCAVTPIAALANGPKLPYVRDGVCVADDVECCGFGEWKTSRAVALRARPTRRAKVVARVGKRQRVTALTGRVVVTRPGLVRLRKAVPTESGARLAAGSTLHVLYPLPEGWSRVWHGEKEHSVETSYFLPRGECRHSDCPGVTLRPSRWRWWVKIRTQRGVVGWTDAYKSFSGREGC
jgi:hypothetical protein